MRYLLDTHVLLWVLADPDRLSAMTRHALAVQEAEISVSVVSLWEIVLKHRVGKLEADIAAIIGQLAPSTKIALLTLSAAHLIELDRLPVHAAHRDPFDHLLIAQAISEAMILVTRNRNASLYAVEIMAA